MTVKNAALLATVGMALWTLLLTLRIVSSVSGFLRGLVPADLMLSSLVQFLAGLSLLVFFFVFHRSQS